MTPTHQQKGRHPPASASKLTTSTTRPTPKPQSGTANPHPHLQPCHPAAGRRQPPPRQQRTHRRQDRPKINPLPFASSAPTLPPPNSDVPATDQLKPTKTNLPVSQYPLKPGPTRGRAGPKNTNQWRTQKILSDQARIDPQPNPHPPPSPTSRSKRTGQSPQTPNPGAVPPTQPPSVSNPAARRPDPPPRPQQTQRHPRPDGTNQNEPLVFRKNPLKLWVGGRGGGRAPKKSKKFQEREKILSGQPNQTHQPTPPDSIPDLAPPQPTRRKHTSKMIPTHAPSPTFMPPTTKSITPNPRAAPPTQPPSSPTSASAARRPDPPPRPQQTQRHPRPDGTNQNEPLVFREKPS